MTTQFTPTLKLALPVTGELSGTWGDVVNDNITSMVEQAIAGLATINTWTTNAHTLTIADGTTSESRCAMLVLTDTGVALTGAATVVCPTASKIYIVKNSTGQIATIKTAAGTGIAVPNGKTMFVFCDGTNVVEAVTSITGAALDFTSLKGTGAVVVTNILDEDNMVSDSATALATQQSIKAYVDSQISANNDLSEILANGNTTGAQDIVVQTGGNITFADNSKAIFGAGSDLQIYHDGSNSYISDQGTGQLRILASQFQVMNAAGTESMVFGAQDNTATLYYDNAAKLATTATGVDITGGINATGAARIGVLNTDTSLTTYGTGTLTISTNGGTNSGTITIAQGVNGNITLAPNGTGKVSVSTLLATADSTFSSTGALLISKGTNAQQPVSPVAGMMRYNSDTNQFEGYSGASPAWKSIGGSALSNDTSTSSNVYPVFAGATTGTAENLYTSNAKLLYKPSTGEFQMSTPVASNGIVVNAQTITANYTIAAGYNASSAGPVTVDSGVTVTVASGSRWAVI